MSKRSERAAFLKRQKARVLARKPLKPRWWHVYHVNCDCASYNMTRRRLTTGTFMRCDYCRKSLGDMEAMYLGRVRATTEWGAIEEADKQRKAGKGKTVLDALKSASASGKQKQSAPPSSSQAENKDSPDLD